MSPQALEIDSITWFDYEIRAAALRLIEAGDKDDIEQRLTEVMSHPRLREVVKFLALFGYGGVWQHFNCASTSVQRYIGVERQLAEDLIELATFVAEKQPDTATAGWLTRLRRKVRRRKE